MDYSVFAFSRFHEFENALIVCGLASKKQDSRGDVGENAAAFRPAGADRLGINRRFAMQIWRDQNWYLIKTCE